MSVHVKSILSVAAVVLTTSGFANAATISATQTLYTTATTTNLTAEGTLDWTKTGPNEPGNYNPIVTVGKAGGTTLSDYVQTPVANNIYIGSIATSHAFSWTDGDSPVSDTSSILKGPGQGTYSFTAAGDTNERVLRVYTGGYQYNSPHLILSLPGTEPIDLTLEKSVYPDEAAYLNVAEVRFTADTAGDVLTVSTSGDAAIYAATLAPAAAVPEPASLALVGLTALLGLRRRGSV